MVRFVMDQDVKMIISVEQLGVVHLLQNTIVCKAWNNDDIIRDNTLAKYPSREVARKVFELFWEWLLYKQDNCSFIFPKYDTWDEKEQCFILTM